MCGFSNLEILLRLSVPKLLDKFIIFHDLLSKNENVMNFFDNA